MKIYSSLIRKHEWNKYLDLFISERHLILSEQCKMLYCFKVIYWGKNIKNIYPALVQFYKTALLRLITTPQTPPQTYRPLNELSEHKEAFFSATLSLLEKDYKCLPGPITPKSVCSSWCPEASCHTWHRYLA